MIESCLGFFCLSHFCVCACRIRNDAECRSQENKARRVSVVFGADRVLEFCAANDIDVIVRAHQCGTRLRAWSEGLFGNNIDLICDGLLADFSEYALCIF
jgi:hypothetical protein